MKPNRHLHENVCNWIDLLKQPNSGLDWVYQQKSRLIYISLGYITYMAVGGCLNLIWPFPHFWGFSGCFFFIGALSFMATVFFSVRMGHIATELADQPAAKKANLFYYGKCIKSNIYIIGPISIVAIFGLGSCSMFGAIQFTPTLIWLVILFFVIVYVSIIGYLQYIVLAVYIRNLACGSEEYKRLPKSATEYIPAQSEWLQKLARLSHIYQSAFFTLGGTYIVAFSAFCWLPEMQVNINSPIFVLLWSIIFVAIIFAFPIISILEYQWIKEIVSKLKKTYIKDLASESNINKKSRELGITPAFHRVIQTIYATQIQNSKDYPVRSVLSVSYSVFLSAFNLVAAAITVFQQLPAFANVLPQIF